MERYTFHQGLFGGNAHGVLDVQLDRLTVSATYAHSRGASADHSRRFTWGIEMTCTYANPCDSCHDDLSAENSDFQADCTPYLLQLGLTKSRTSLVWIAGPLSGLIMQPIVGVIADRSRSKWGRRKPFMVGGAIIVGLCLLVLGWTKEIVGLFITEPSTVGLPD